MVDFDQPGNFLLPVQPDILETPVVVDAVFLPHVVLDLRMPALRGAAVIQNRAGDIVGQLALDLPDDLAALIVVTLLTLRGQQRVDLKIAVFREIIVRLEKITLKSVSFGGFGDSLDKSTGDGGVAGKPIICFFSAA